MISKRSLSVQVFIELLAKWVSLFQTTHSMSRIFLQALLILEKLAKTLD